jgi:hypothetical protein
MAVCRSVNVLGSSMSVLLVGDVAGVMGLPTDAIEAACAGSRISRTVLRSEALRILRSERIDLVLTSSGAGFLQNDEFLAAFAAHAPLAVLVAARQPDPAALGRFTRAGVHAEYLTLPIDAADLHRRVQAALRPPPPRAAAPPPPLPPPELPIEPLHNNKVKDDRDMANISKSLEEAMKIDGAIAAALADWDSGLCLGTAGGGARLNIEIAAAGNCQVVKAKMSTMNELGIKGAIQDILITLDDQIHLIRPLRRSENLFLYVAIDKAKGNLGLARHRVQKIEAELNV